MSKRDYLSEIVQRKKRNTTPLRIVAFLERHEAITEAYRGLLMRADPSATNIDVELCRYFPIALVAAIEGYFRQAIADLANAGEPYRTRVEAAIRRSPKPDIAEAVSLGEITLGDWYAHVTSFGSLHDIDRVLSDILEFPFLEHLINSEFGGLINDRDEEFNLRGVQQDVIDAAADLFQTRHMLCHEFSSAVKPDNAAIMRMFTVSDVLVALSEVIIFVEAEQDVQNREMPSNDALDRGRF